MFPFLRTIFLLLCVSVLVCSCGKSERRDVAAGSSSGNGMVSAPDSMPAAGRSEDSVTVTLFMVRHPSDADTIGTFGCGDLLVKRPWRVWKKGNLLEETMRALVSPEHDGLENYVAGGTIRLDSVVMNQATAQIYLQGHFVLNGVCDHPRIEEQLRQTAMQFPEVKAVAVYVGLQPLKEYLSLK
jgi:hypothetical protein